MKKGIVIALLSACVTFVATATVCKIKTENYIKTNLYARTGIVTQIDYENDLVIVKCANGNTYPCRGVEDYDIGDIVSLVAKKNKTEVVTDDNVVSHRYDGFIELLKQIN